MVTPIGLQRCGYQFQSGNSSPIQANDFNLCLQSHSAPGELPWFEGAHANARLAAGIALLIRNQQATCRLPVHPPVSAFRHPFCGHAFISMDALQNSISAPNPFSSGPTRPAIIKLKEKTQAVSCYGQVPSSTAAKLSASRPLANHASNWSKLALEIRCLAECDSGPNRCSSSCTVLAVSITDKLFAQWPVIVRRPQFTEDILMIRCSAR